MAFFFVLGTSAAFAMPNPATEFCLQLGGTSIRNQGTGEVPSLCKFAGGGQIEQWTLYREMNDGKKSEALDVFWKHPEVSQDSKGRFPINGYCSSKSVGGKIVSDPRFAGDGGGVCTFSDESSIAVSTLYDGPKSPKNAALVEALRSGKKYKRKMGPSHPMGLPMPMGNPQGEVEGDGETAPAR